MNNKALFGMSLVSFAALIVIVSIGLAFGLLFGLDIISKLGMHTQDQVIKDIDNANNANEIILNFLNAKDEQGTITTDLIILSVKNNDYKNLKKESEKFFSKLPNDIYWELIINSNKKELFEIKKEFTIWKESEEEMLEKATHKINLITNLQDHPILELIFTLVKGDIKIVGEREAI